MWYIFSNFINPQNFETEKLLSVFTELCACCVQSSCLRPWTCTVSHAMVDVIGNQINSFPPRIWQFLGELMCRSIQSTWHYPVISMCVYVCVCVCVCVSVSHIQLFMTSWTVAHQAPLSMGFLRQEYLEWFTISSSRESSQFRDGTHISCTGRQMLYHWATREA